MKPMKSNAPAPGPGAVLKRDWAPIAKKRLEGPRVVLYTDGARTYKLKLRGVLHDQAIHKKKKVMLKGKPTWVNPKYSNVHCHILPDKYHMRVKTCTRIIDRFWQHLRAGLKCRKKVVGLQTLE